MALLLLESTNNFTSSNWKTIDSTSFLNSETTSSTTTTSFVGSSTFTPGAITVEGIMVKNRYVVTNSGTFTVELYNNTAAASVAGTTVTINVSDINFTNLSGNVSTGGFIYMKFASPVVLLAATLYSVRLKTSVSGTLAMNSSTGTNWSRGLVTSTTAAPAASDNLYMCGPITTTSTPGFITCTYNNTATTVWGSIEMGAYAKNILENSASTAYVMKIANAGKYLCTLNSESEFGTIASRVQSTSSFLMELQAASAGSNGLEVRSPAKFTAVGTSRTRKAKLAANSSAGATSLTTDISTGWKNGDNIVFCNTTRSGTPAVERKALTADASGTTLTITAMTAAKLGTGLLVCDIGNVTSNVQIYGTSITSTYYILTGVSSTVGGAPYLYLDNVEIRYIGSNTADKYGITLYGTTGSTATITNCGIHDCHANCRGFSFPSNGTMDNFTIEFNVLYGGSYGSQWGSVFAYAGTKKLNDNLFIGQSQRALLLGNGLPINDAFAFECKRNISSGSSGYGFQINFTNVSSGFSDNTSYGNANSTLYGALIRSTISNINGYINNYYGSQIYGYDSTLDGGTFFGNQYCNIGLGTVNNFVFSNLSLQNYLSLTTDAVIANANTSRVFFDNCSIGTVSVHSRTVENLTGIFDMTFRNCTIADSTIMSFGASDIPYNSGAKIQRSGGTAKSHLFYKRYGTITNDQVIYDTSPVSLRMAPNSTSSKLVSNYFQIAVANGTTATFSVKVRKSVVGDGTAYNGNQPRLILKASPGAGSTYNSDIVCATASAAAGTWETLTYTLPVAVTDDVGLEFYIDCDGTTGWVNIDSITVS